MIINKHRNKVFQAVGKVTLQEVTMQNFNDCMGLERKSSRYVGNAADVLAGAYVARKTATAYGIYAGDTVVGLVVICTEPNEKGYWFNDLFIADGYQNKGYAKEAVRLILEKFKAEKKSDTVEIQVNYTNKYAIKTYEYHGLSVTGKAKWDENFLIMSLSLQ